MCHNEYYLECSPLPNINIANFNCLGSDGFLYYTGDLNSKELAGDIQPVKELLVGKLEHVNVWVGQAGVETHLHRDNYHNFFAQIIGRKHFIICPPNQDAYVYSFPFLHPSNAQSQLNLTDPNLTKYPQARKLSCWETEVPGRGLHRTHVRRLNAINSRRFDRNGFDVSAFRMVYEPL